MVYQLGSSMMDAFVLAIVREQDAYGYLISQKIKKGVDLKESTLYPVLKRLQEGGYLETYDQQFQGRNRKYYHLTSEGLEQYRFYLDEWDRYKNYVDEILKGDEGNDKT